MKKSLFLAVAVLFAFGAGCGSSQPTNTASNSQPSSQQDVAVGGQNIAVQTYALADVALHTTASDCWMAIDGKVYNATSFIPNHPGGDKILQGCGKDATSLFDGIKGGRGHSQDAADIMQALYIGDLKQ
ncbi:MAG: cytochrome b5-like heme/steroid binding domain-containing protein [Patescibacteria group bacterium]|nr:cytochrome b5-like heme/steroid binding domain-containing protein [Patescibacteria group bacterium]